MPLTNTQHNSIMRVYDNIRTGNQHILDTRIEEVYSLCPEFKDVEDEIIEVSMSAAVARIGKSSECVDYTAKLEELSNRRTKLLASIGKPADYLDPIYTCPTCRDTGYFDHTRCECFKKKAVDLVYSDSNLKNITDSENFDTFSYEWYDNSTVDPTTNRTPYNNMQQVVSICKDFVTKFDSEFSNLLLFGDTGVGKTFLSNCIARELLDTSHSVIYLTAIELFKKFEQQDFNKSYKDSDADSDYILDCDLLIIDDLGTEVGNTYTNSKLFYVINERILRQKSVIISTNLCLSDIRDVYSERIFSRITNSYKILKLFGNDIRIMKRTKR
ncbi:MAG: ATP-binding protein [Lachnospira sp.]|nr:ATP-binding protein [Lachnospira sp.]